MFWAFRRLVALCALSVLELRWALVDRTGEGAQMKAIFSTIQSVRGKKFGENAVLDKLK